MRRPQEDTVRVAFVSTRIAGTDGVSLEIAKWAHVLERMGIECYYIAGELDRPAERSALIPEAHFDHPEILEVSRRSFGTEVRTPELSEDIRRLARQIHDQLAEAVERLQVRAVIAQELFDDPYEPAPGPCPGRGGQGAAAGVRGPPSRLLLGGGTVFWGTRSTIS